MTIAKKEKEYIHLLTPILQDMNYEHGARNAGQS